MTNLYRRKNGKSEVSLDINIKPQNESTPLYGTIEVCASNLSHFADYDYEEDVFKKIGYLDAKGERIACCDEDAYRVALWK